MALLTKNIFIKNILLVLALSLILSFVLHEIIPHQHHASVYGTGTEAAFHTDDRKVWYALLLVFLFVGVVTVRRVQFSIRTTRPISFSHTYLLIDLSKLFNPIVQALKAGILHPKLCH